MERHLPSRIDWLGLAACLAALVSIIGGWVYVFAQPRAGDHLFQEGGWQWFAATFPHRTVHAIGWTGVGLGVLSLALARRPRPFAVVGIVLSAVGAFTHWRW